MNAILNMQEEFLILGNICKVNAWVHLGFLY